MSRWCSTSMTIFVIVLLCCCALLTESLTSIHKISSSIHKSKQRPSFPSLKAKFSMPVDNSPQFDHQIAWFQDALSTPGAQKLDVKEWEDEEWRQGEGGFSGVDFCHSKQAAVRIVNYVLLPPHSPHHEPDPYPRLLGIAYFTPRAESHRGLCHGGSFCALMDDAIGWMGFCVTGRVLPWSGYTVQVNTSLKKSVPVGSILRLESWVSKRESARKFWVHARLSDPVSHDVHCEGNGLFLLSHEHVDAVSSLPVVSNS